MNLMSGAVAAMFYAAGVVTGPGGRAAAEDEDEDEKEEENCAGALLGQGGGRE